MTESITPWIEPILDEALYIVFPKFQRQHEREAGEASQDAVSFTTEEGYQEKINEIAGFSVIKGKRVQLIKVSISFLVVHILFIFHFVFH